MDEQVKPLELALYVTPKAGELDSACQWGGHGGSVVFNDHDTGLTVAYAMNQMQPEGDMRGTRIINAATSSLEPLWRRAARQGRRAGRAARRRLRA